MAQYGTVMWNSIGSSSLFLLFAMEHGKRCSKCQPIMVLICFNGTYDGEKYLQLTSNKNRSQCPHSWSCFANIDCLGSASLIFWSFNLPVWNSPWISWCCFTIFATLGVRQISQVSVAKDLPPSWSGLLLKDALCKLNQVGINICPKTMLKVTVWRHMISSWFWNRCCCELLFPPTIMSESGGGDGKLMLETTSVFAGSPRQSSATSKWWSASFNSTTQPWHSCQFGFMTHHPKTSVMPFWLKHLQPTSWGADMCNRLPVVLSIDNLRHEPKKSRSRV